MTDENDFDRKQEREEDREDDKFSAKLTVEDFSKINMQRCCVFVKDFISEDGGEMIHGRLMGVMAELDALVVRDLRLGREVLQSKQIVPYDNVHHLCASPSLEKCRLCREYQEMEKEARLEARLAKPKRAKGADASRRTSEPKGRKEVQNASEK